MRVYIKFSYAKRKVSGFIADSFILGDKPIHVDSEKNKHLIVFFSNNPINPTMCCRSLIYKVITYYCYSVNNW